MNVTISSDKVVFTIPVRDLRGAGVVSGSELRIYAYSHRLGGGGAGTSEVTWDTAGTGAAPAPAQLTFDAPDETSYVGVVALAIVAVIVVLLVVQWFRGDFPFRHPGAETEEPAEPEEPEWVEFE